MSLRARIAQLPLSRIARFMAVFSIALAIGHLAQTIGAEKPVAVATQVVDMPTHIVNLSSGGETEAAATPRVMVAELPAATPAAPVCTIDLALRAMPSAMIEASVAAPCHVGERIVLRQAALAVTARIGADGKMTVLLPALTTEGAVAVLFAGGQSARQAIAMPEVEGLRRFGVQWQGADAFVLHGMEQGADFDEPGDISHRNPGRAGDGGGFLTVLGDTEVENPLLAEVYTFPADPAVQPEIVLEAAVLAETCGNDLLGEILISRAGQVETTDLSLAMPDCSAIGDFLVLNNLVSDLKIAAN